VWTQITVDPDAGLVYLPVETPTVDLYGGNRPGDNLFAESLVAVDLHTGKRKWHFQIVHHPLWDHDLSSAAMVVDIDVDGKPVKAIAMPTKQSFLYMFDRITGKPIWPIPEKPVPQTDVPGEVTSATQPIPTRPAPYARAWVKPSDIIDFTPELHAQAMENLKHYRWLQSPYVPPLVPNPDKYLAAINIGNFNGGTNWPGGSLDPVRKVAYIQANNSSINATAIEPVPPERGDAGYTSGGGASGGPMSGPYALDKVNEEHPMPQGQGRGGLGIDTRQLTKGLQGLPILKPPYGVLTAIDLDTGDQLWQVPHGETPDYIRHNPALKGIDLPRTGQG
ncbi:MAG TPA: pyrroloquinoline quinone-dependent dehydrogenase, partial [Gammaproteobacteria bacterium]|nr:pyrroloquinoline quinone-dependent dehydrogenase [Gammaproteobacteria bacterium]